ncbi:MAG: tetratricopeptide repeat protein [Candidatus Xenobiia bacterium LiM19]
MNSDGSMDYKENDITMDKEILTITVNQEEAEVKALFWLKNTSSQTQWRTIIFPLGGGLGSGIVIDPTMFTVRSEGKELKTTSQTRSGSEDGYGNLPSVHSLREWNMSFPPLSTAALSVEYRQSLLRDFWYGTVATREFFYILKSGAYWKDNIRHFELTIRWKDVNPWQRICVESPDLWKSDRFDRTGKTSPELNLSQEEIKVVKKNLKPVYPGLDILILVNSGTSNLFPNADKLLNESLAGKFDHWHHVKVKKKFVMAGNVYYDKGDAEKAFYFWNKALENKKLYPDFRMETLLGMALLSEQLHMYDESFGYYTKCTECYKTKVSKTTCFNGDVHWMYKVAIAGAARVEALRANTDGN